MTDTTEREAYLAAFDQYARQFTYRNHPAEPKHFPKASAWFEAGFHAGRASQAAPLPVAEGVMVPVGEVVALRRNAARYKWLREQNWFDGPLCVLRDPKKVLTRGSGLGADCPSGGRLDAAIDAQIAAPPSPGTPVPYTAQVTIDIEEKKP